MLPANRKEFDVEPYAIPKFSIEKRDIKEFIEELKGFHQEFRDCFYRSEPRDNFFRYMVGQLSDLERKSIEPMSTRVEGGKARSMQRMISDVLWNEEMMLGRYRRLVKDDMADPCGVIIFDETGFPKKGDESIGVSKQYCGSLGKVENCQVGVFAAYASPHGYALVDKELFIPEKWFTAEYADKRQKCKVPADIEFKTKPQLASEMLHRLIEENILPFRYVLADSIYGNSPEFIRAVEDHVGLSYFVSIPSDTKFWFQRPVTDRKDYRHKGEKRTKQKLRPKTKAPLEVRTFAKSLNKFFWYKRKVSEGSKGPIEYEFTKRRVVLCKDGLPERTVWLIIKRTIGNNPVYYYSISNAPVSTKLETFVWLSGLRWPIEQCFEEAKTELGMDHYEVRKYPGWHHHILTSMLSHFFLWHLKIILGGEGTEYYAIAA
jgi:SRSO17 transposase